MNRCSATDASNITANRPSRNSLSVIRIFCLSSCSRSSIQRGGIRQEYAAPCFLQPEQHHGRQNERVFICVLLHLQLTSCSCGQYPQSPYLTVGQTLSSSRHTRRMAKDGTFEPLQLSLEWHLAGFWYLLGLSGAAEKQRNIAQYQHRSMRLRSPRNTFCTSK